MIDEKRGTHPASAQELGDSFAASNSPSYGGDLGADFEAKNSVDPEHYDRIHHRVDLDARRRQRLHKWYWLAGLLLLILTFFLVHRFTATSDNTRASSGAAGASGAQGHSGASGSSGGGGRGQQGPAAITVGQSRSGNMPIYNDALGTVTPVYTVTVYPQVSGRVMAVYYKEGQIVRKGQPLVEIDPRPYQATLTQAEGTLKRDQGVLSQAEIDLARYQAAYARNAIAKQQLDDQQQIVEQDKGTVLSDQGNVDYDKVQLAYCHIVSPISGRVGLRLVDPGNTVFSGAASTLVVITQLQPITVVFNVSEDALPQIQDQLKAGKPLPVDAYDRSDDKKIETGRLSSLDNIIDTATGTLKFRANFDNKGLALFPNQFVNARLRVKDLQNIVLVPSAAVQHNGTASFVYIVKPNNTVAVQPITTLASNEQDTAVSGVAPNTTLATSGFDRLEPGAQVLVRGRGQGRSGSGNGNTPGGTTAP
ncbi:MAG TPA: efflux RND transporter periplasmic adaptor subunit [Acidobacteriaceae bacterium]|nr:efflux RND transporter periplasmic adaptor subunit [Acidobacteriaceae bacterium]